jgi:serine/threonine protein kinase
MKAENYCMGCMEKREQGPVCPYCGYQHDTLPESPLYLTPGTILNGKYLIGRVLGHGGFGITYLALDLTLQVRLAIKEFLPRDLATRSSNTTTVTPYTGATKEHFDYGLEKFLEEARALARFEDSPCIVSVKDFFRANGTAYFVMNFVEGITFKEYLKNHGEKIDYDKALRILMPVMDALREVHQTGLLHRDISPDNIYITNDGRIKLLDFGAARNATGEHSKSLSVMLKAGYAPEEQYRSKGKQGPWTDIYAVGATLYRAITGKVPVEALDRLDEDTLEPPTRLGIKIPPHAENALLKALSVKASDRFQEMKMFQQALMMEPDEVNVKIPVGEIPTGSQKSFATNAEEQKTATANNLPEKDNRYKAMIICIAALITIGILLFFTAG